MNELQVHVRYFAILKEFAQKDAEAFDISNTKTYAEIYLTLKSRYHFPLDEHAVQVAVNDEFAAMEDLIMPGATIVFIPPVAGG